MCTTMLTLWLHTFLGTGCVTELTGGGKEKGKPCVFPFSYKGVNYTKCTDVDHSMHWCSTNTDENGHHIGGKWGDCKRTDRSCFEGMEVQHSIALQSCITLYPMSQNMYH